MSQMVFTKVIRRLSTNYGMPNVPDRDALYDEFCKALTGYAEPVLDLALDRIIKTRTFPTWPTVGEVVTAARDAAGVLAPRPKPELVPAIEKKHVGPERIKELLKQTVGQGLNGDNDFEAIVARCPRGGSIKIDTAWGEEVKDSNGKVVPIRVRRGRAA